MNFHVEMIEPIEPNQRLHFAWGVFEDYSDLCVAVVPQGCREQAQQVADWLNSNQPNMDTLFRLRVPGSRRVSREQSQ